MLNKELEFTLNLVFKAAKDQRHEFITVEHLLLFLLDNPSAGNVLLAHGVNIDALRHELAEFIEATTPRIPDSDGLRETQPTPGFQRVLQRAVFQVQSAGHGEVCGANVVAAILSENESHAALMLREQNVSRLDIIHYLTNGTPRLQHDEPDYTERYTPDFEQEVPIEKGDDPLELYCSNLSQKALLGRIDPVIGREAEVQRTVQILCRRRKNNPLLVGEAGVGKTAIAEGLARLIIEGKVPEAISTFEIHALDIGALLAGTKYRGDFEKRFKMVLGKFKDNPNAVLFIDEIHTIIGAGAASGGVVDASNLLKPLLASSEVKCIGSTTYQEYRGIFEKDRALARRFQKIDIGEPSVEETFYMLKGLRRRLEAHHVLKYSTQALHAAAELSDRYINERFLPDKAIDVLDEAGSYQKLQVRGQRKNLITVAEVEETVARMANIPVAKISTQDKEVLSHLEDDLKQVIYGQEEAISALTTAVKLNRAGLREPHKPMGCFLFSGPTGVGKTEVTRQLAEILSVDLLRFDMSEYMEKHTVSRLIGAPPGYVGYDQGGLLTEAVTKHPYCVLLLDEIEKAHSDIFNILLQVMDNGTLTDSNGREADFRHVIVVMTTNVGANDLEKQSIGFTAQKHQNDNLKALKRQFSPEFRNRLDAVINFSSLSMDVVELVVDKFLVELAEQLKDKHVVLDIDARSKHWIAEHGYDEHMGARPMARLIQEKIKMPLADELLFGKLSHGGRVHITVQENELCIESEVLAEVTVVE